MMPKERYWDYVTFNERGVINGVRDDTPVEIRREYEESIRNTKIIKENLLRA